MTPLRERNQAAVGAVTLVVLVLSLVVVYSAEDLPLFGAGTTYSAHFAESAGLEPDDEVQVAGVKVGEVDSVELAGRTVLVTFRVEGIRVGAASTASIEIKTLLGEKFLALRPAGDTPQDPAEPIPLERTRTPFQLQDAFEQLSTTVTELDTDRLAQSLTVLADALQDTPPHLREALDGLTALSRTVSSRDAELGELLAGASQVSTVLADRNAQLERVIADGNLLLSELQRRRDAISALLRGARELSAELTGLVADNRRQLRPALERLGTVTDILQRNQDNLNRSLALLAPFTRVGANATGNGRWFEGYICGLLPPVIVAGGARVNPEGCSPPISAPDQGITQQGGGR
ncbi:phospholipid/cholesterol/gamma-HCH transport system substrate-binding protein [Amycolatopsis arida]|uniref:Phospholipid/cholesterol/gamma-HCH transport system substrate-binding protein n=1 Tax=Amycolatopsis arida TaxID=587909 RepID=A0A1I5XLA6_9PSEU|nr:MCE family protein [Amycolatopsis arida]TDX97382.1 phospholipid/cholesterol/gamma-HCH transport system substrate-binding protein [Amycolatopsis arida]SFQ32596.1 phospholipid/cholesterol/gamma-HCH transport system substrate-binding protein [Amycolatopsis arida]